MAAEFRLAHLPRVDQQVRDLAAKASQFQIKQDFSQELRTTVERLRVQPKDVGDPIRKTALPGGTVYRVVVPPFIMYYAFYDRDRLVLILDVLPFPLSFPE